MLREEEARNMICIHRNKPTSDETPPWEGITFVFPVGSDLLADHLKNAYPHCKNLRQRKHQAAIHFLSLELEEMRQKDGEQPVLSEIQIDHQFGSPKTASNELADNTSSNSSQQNTPSCTSPTTPHSIQSPQLTDRSRAHTDQHAALETQKPLKSDATTSVQTYIFSAVDGRPHQPKTKRKMTIEERVLYKERRKRGACSKCKRMKGRCTHLGELEIQDCKETVPAIISDLDHSSGTSVAKDLERRTKRRSPPVPDSASGEELAKAQKGEWSQSARLRSPEVHDNPDYDTIMGTPYDKGPDALGNPQRPSVVETSPHRDGNWNIVRGRVANDLFSPPSSISSNLNGSSSSNSPTPTNTAATTPASTTLV